MGLGVQAGDQVSVEPVPVGPWAHEAIHTWFGLSYANYLVLPRATLQSMPDDWQEEFVLLLEELHERMADVPVADTYQVSVRSFGGRFMTDPTPHYNRGRTHVGPPKTDPRRRAQ